MRNSLLALGLIFSAQIQAATLDSGLISENAGFYLHANIEEMQLAPAGQHIYEWLEDEVLEELRDDTGIDVSDVLTGISVFGPSVSERYHSDEAVFILHGEFSPSDQAQIIEALEQHVDITTSSQSGQTVYHLIKASRGHDMYLSFGPNQQTIITKDEAQLERFLDGQQKQLPDTRNKILILQAESPLVQGGLNTQIQNNTPWDSSILRNVEQVAVVISDDAGQLRLQANLLAAKPEMAMALQNLVQGLIALSALNEDEPEIAELLSQAHIEAEGNRVVLEITVDPETLMDFVD